MKNQVLTSAVLTGLIILLSIQCQVSTVPVKPFGQVDSVDVFLYTLENKNGVRIDITNYGGTIVRWLVPDRNGKLEDITLGFNTIGEYVENSVI